jgi:hypothetical protein
MEVAQGVNWGKKVRSELSEPVDLMLGVQELT